MTISQKKWLIGAAVVLVIGVLAVVAWQRYGGKGQDSGFASGNGRIEGTEIDVAAKLAGRISAIFVDEGAFVSAGQVVAHMDTATLEAQRREAQAQWRLAQHAVEVARSTLAQRESEKAAAQAVVLQREAEYVASQKQSIRSTALAKTGSISQQIADNDRAKMLSDEAAISAARAQVAASEAGIITARAQIAEAQAAVESMQASIERYQADINDSELRSPRDGRVQYRVAQPGEVVGAGGRVLNLVDLSDVYMTFFLPTKVVGQVALGTEVRLVLDAFPQLVIPASVTFVADVAQFTPKTVETAVEREKLMFRIKANIPADLLRAHIKQVKTGLPGIAYIRLDPSKPWPAHLQIRLPP
jgi:HlyD family secretion protein